MNPADRSILQHLISDLYDWLRYSPCSMFPIDTPAWKETYAGMGVSGDYELDKKVKDVLRIAIANFGGYKFRLHYPENEKDETSKVEGPFKVYLAYTKFVWPEEQE